MPAAPRHLPCRPPRALRLPRRRRDVGAGVARLLAGLIVALAAAGGPAPSASAADDAAPEWIRDVKPLLGRCLACHGALRQRAGLRLDTAAALHAAGVVDPASPAMSTLVAALEGAGTPRMPPEGEGEPLTAAEIDVVRGWIAAGARGPADER
ncbi:MAG: c-type cytochrome domain-containing protein, partial [Planctomycetaceae bacterium]